MGVGVGGEVGVSVGGGTLGVLVGKGVSVASEVGVIVGLGVLVGVGTGVGALATNEVSGHTRHPNALPKTNTGIRITNRDLLIVLYCFHSPLKQSGQRKALQPKEVSGTFGPYYTILHGKYKDSERRCFLLLLA
jgi:hypothetical protein